MSIAKEGLQKERCDNRERTIVDREDVGLEPVEETYASGSKIQREKKRDWQSSKFPVDQSLT